MSKQKQICVYFLIVIIPTIISVLVFFNFLKEREKAETDRHLEWVASIHKKQMDQFIGETMISNNILAVSFEPMLGQLNSIKATLIKTIDKDPRYGGIYLLDQNGNIITGTNDLLKQYNLKNMQYFKEVMLTKQTVVSEQQEKLVNGQSVLAVATPILNETDVKAVLVSHIRIDYIQNIMKLLTPEQTVTFVNAKEIPIFTVNGDSITQNDDSVVYPLDRLPWNIVLKKDYTIYENVIKQTFIFSIITFVLLHFLYLFFKYRMLKKQTIMERMQNEAQKLELIGTLAASTAHEIRNPLTGIKGLVQLLNEKYTDESDQFYFSVIDKEIARINQIVSEFLILGKPTVQKMQSIDINEIIKDLNPLIYSEANLYNVQYKVHLTENPLYIKCCKDQMKQVILNLAKNAFEAMASEGTLELSVEFNDHFCHIYLIDNGPGISEEDLANIFLPFFTSKESGTGLGLVVCKRIIEAFNGEIKLKSKVNEGTMVTLILPLG
ncbi:two-component system, sporulation sensor kinase D [Oikeobacillus pervagus]|uniref:histidine kinase n=1 Tax=Oikeobacillus pervagus TaxID=1325931 RepID=A0AAJ1WIP0_9BACI|nr:PAS domain-containing sensor histidine kinase [Oikeobacillus pervagus]MDQ0214845.1 two-component system, sporulation sensor kinase D [Oikeobacillus pervagus]